MSIYKIVQRGCVFHAIGNVMRFNWPNEQIRQAIIESNWGDWRPVEGLIGKVMFKFKLNFYDGEGFILKLNDGHYVAIRSDGCELVQPQSNKYTKRYLELIGG